MSYPGGDSILATISDYGSGYGRVARFLRAAFPSARLEVTDHDMKGPKWCVENLGCFEMVLPIKQAYYDLMWLGSVFTHLPTQNSIDLLATLVAALRPLGVLIFTTGGRLGADNIRGHLERRSDHRYSGYSLEDSAIRKILEDFNSQGYGYADYPGQVGYGGALVKPEWIQREMAKYPVVQLGFQEMAWDTHQDVYAFMRVEGAMVAFAQNKGPYF
jgi:SAM-dependent methyltransferase